MQLLQGKNITQSSVFKSLQNNFKEDNDIFNFLKRLLLLSDEEKKRAGIYIGAKGREWIESSSIIIPSSYIDPDIS
jgi:hypothetical protein